MENLCDICPRNCKVNRESKLGFCQSTNAVKIAKVMLHYFEEPPISGEEIEGKKPNGSGAIFFSGCNLKCIYCQNSEISQGGVGKEISIETLADLFRQLENAGANNINLVTPSHYTLQIIEALKIYRPKIPIVWNTSGYEKPETIAILKGFVDIFLTDFKYFDSKLSSEFSFASNYPEMCKASLLEMRKVQPNDEFENGLMKKGIIVRHLILPGCTADSKDIFAWIDKNLGNKTYVSLMAQYVPMAKAKDNPKINRKITPLEYKIVLKHLENLGFENAFVQELGSADTCYTPNFAQDEKIFKFWQIILTN